MPPARGCAFLSSRGKGKTEQSVRQIGYNVKMLHRHASLIAQLLNCVFLFFISQRTSTGCSNVFIHPSARFMMNKTWASAVVWTSVHICASRWQHGSKLDCQSCIHISHTKLSTYAFTSGNKDACRCFRDPELCGAASVFAWERNRQWNGEMIEKLCRRLCACAQSCENATGKY